MEDVQKAVKENRVSLCVNACVEVLTTSVASLPLMHTYLCLQLKEIFGSGTACVVCPVDRILYLEEVNYQYCTILYLTAS